MTKVDLLEREVKKLDRPSLTIFRNWFKRYDSALWDRQISGDSKSGKLDKLANQALVDHRAGKTKKL